MHMRLLHVEVEPDGIQFLRRLYEERIIGALGEQKGCRFAGLMQSIQHPEQCLSLTLWDSPSDADTYEKSGLFLKLLEESKIYLSDTVEYSIKLSEDLQVEYIPVTRDPVVKSYPIAAQSEASGDRQQSADGVWLRIVSLKILPGKMEEFKKLYTDHSIPALRAARGCRHVYLLETEDRGNEVLSVTIWNSREDAEEYEKGGVFEHLLELQKHTLSGLAQWKKEAGGDQPQKSMSTEDVLVEHYTILTGKNYPAGR